MLGKPIILFWKYPFVYFEISIATIKIMQKVLIYLSLDFTTFLNVQIRIHSFIGKFITFNIFTEI